VKVLGVARLIRLGYLDSGMRGWESNQNPQAFINQSPSEVSQRLLDLMQEIAPHIVLTHNSHGDYGHPDHVFVYETALAAFKSYCQAVSESPDPKTVPVLYSHLMSSRMLKMAVIYYRLLGKDPRHFGENGDVDLLDLANQKYPVHARLNYASVLRLKKQASACHASQGGGAIVTGLDNLIHQLIETPKDEFTQVWPKPLQNQTLKKDLFEGISL